MLQVIIVMKLSLSCLLGYESLQRIFFLVMMAGPEFWLIQYHDRMSMGFKIIFNQKHM